LHNPLLRRSLEHSLRFRANFTVDRFTIQSFRQRPSGLSLCSRNPGNKEPNVIVGYSASSKGALTPLPGLPFQQNVGSMAVNGKYLMAVNNSNPPDIDTL